MCTGSVNSSNQTRWSVCVRCRKCHASKDRVFVVLKIYDYPFYASVQFVLGMCLLDMLWRAVYAKQTESIIVMMTALLSRTERFQLEGPTTLPAQKQNNLMTNRGKRNQLMEINTLLRAVEGCLEILVTSDCVCLQCIKMFISRITIEQEALILSNKDSDSMSRRWMNEQYSSNSRQQQNRAAIQLYRSSTLKSMQTQSKATIITLIHQRRT